MITKAQFNEHGISISDEIIGNAALEWISENTTLTVDLNDVTTLESLPFMAKAFVAKYEEAVSASSVVQSESIEGLSQSFKTGDKTDLIWDLANTLLGGYLKGRIKFISATKRWR